MENALQEISLAIFTTLTPIGAGSFIVLFISFLNRSFSPSRIAHLDRLTTIPIAFIVIGFVCSFSHLASPGNAFYVLNTIGTTPLANEMVAFTVFLIIALVYWILGLSGKLTNDTARMIFCGCVTVSGLIAVIFMGLAYMIPALPIWDAPRSVIEIVSIWLFGGTALGMFMCAIAGTGKKATRADELTSKAVMGIGAFLLIGSSISVFLAGSSMSSAIIDVSENAQSLIGFHLSATVMIILASVFAFLGKYRMRIVAFSAALLLAVVACFFIRLCFYGMQISIGL